MTAQCNYSVRRDQAPPAGQFKSRDVGLVFRYNYLDAARSQVPDFAGNLTPYQGNGARKMDMVDVEASALMGHAGDADYQTTYVYGNVFVNDWLQSADCFHYGGDSGATAPGTLFFYDNTFEYIADQSDIYNAGIFDVDSSATVQAFNNIFHQDTRTAGGTPTSLGFMYNGGNLAFGTCYASPGIADWTYGTPNGTVVGGAGDANTKLIHDAGDNPGFSAPGSGITLAAGAFCSGKAGTLLSGVLPADNVAEQYLAPMQQTSAPASPISGPLPPGFVAGHTYGKHHGHCYHEHGWQQQQQWLGWRSIRRAAAAVLVVGWVPAWACSSPWLSCADASSRVAPPTDARLHPLLGPARAPHMAWNYPRRLWYSPKCGFGNERAWRFVSDDERDHLNRGRRRRFGLAAACSRSTTTKPTRPLEPRQRRTFLRSVDHRC